MGFAAHACASGIQAAEKGSPNIVFVLFDDMGWGQPESYNAQSKLRTPNLDRLAKEGMRFTDAHSASGVCTPTRFGILTGRYPCRIGQFGVLTTYSKPIIPAERVTVASMLKQHGYTTACIGKWHLGMNWVDGKPGTESKLPVGAQMTDGPNALGFDYFCGYTHARNIGSIIEQDRVLANVEAIENQPLMIRKAVEWIGQRRDDEPFFLYFPMCPPHTPVVPSDEYLGKSGAVDVVGKDKKYGDWLFQADAMLGRVVEALEKQKLADNTLLLVSSDNGAAGRAYAPLRASKASIYEGGHRVPLVVRWPGKVKAGSTTERTVCLNDLMATAAEVIGATIPATVGEDSVSMLGTLLGRDDAHEREATVHQSAAGDLAIRQGAWKLIFHTDGRRELFDLANDLSETNDVITANAEVAARLGALMQSYIDRGRSTPGEAQENEFRVSLEGGMAKKKSRGKSAD
jgi:arylsulfatase A-like enzyme